MTASRANTLMVILAIAASSGLLANDIFLPLLPLLTDALGVSVPDTQLLLMHFLVVMGLTQLVYPVLSDHLGRKQTLFLGLIFFCGASVALVWANTFAHIILWRSLQAIGAGLCLSMSRVIMRTQLPPEESRRGFMLVATIMGIMPATAPILGFFLYGAFGLQACFIFSAIFAFIIFIFVWHLAPAENTTIRSHITPTYFTGYKQITSSKQFWIYANTPCFAYAAYFSYVCVSPYLLERHGLSVAVIAFSYSVLSTTYFLGSISAKRLAARHGIEQALTVGYCFFLAGGLWVWAELAQETFSPIRCVLAMSILTLGNGFLLPLGTAATLEVPSPRPILLPAMLGFFQFCIAAGAAYLASRPMLTDVSHVGSFIAFITSVAFAANILSRYLQRASVRGLLKKAS